MLDTGVDIPEVVNLVFAKPVKSYVKFWQMIGRGTRLCPNCFGPGKHKEHFLIFDHWGNFEYFESLTTYEEPEQISKSLPQTLFEARVHLAEAALAAQDPAAFKLAADLIRADILDLNESTIPVREYWRDKRTVEQPEVLKAFSAATKATLTQTIAPLMQWRNVIGKETALRFDRLVANCQSALLAAPAQASGTSDESARRAAEGGESTDGYTVSAGFTELAEEIRQQVSALKVNLSQVEEKLSTIKQVKDPAWWAQATVATLDAMRRDLRGIIHLRDATTDPRPGPTVIDVADSDLERSHREVKLGGNDLVAYRHRVQGMFESLFQECPALQKIRQNQPVTEADIADLAAKVSLRDPSFNLDDLLQRFPNNAGRIELAIRAIIGLDAEAVNTHFQAFVAKYPTLTAHQLRFLALLKGHIATYGSIDIEKLYESPFTDINAAGPDGVFPEAQVDDLIELILTLNKAA